MRQAAFGNVPAEAVKWRSTSCAGRQTNKHAVLQRYKYPIIAFALKVRFALISTDK